jgi:hypothetical protein
MPDALRSARSVFALIGIAACATPHLPAKLAASVDVVTADVPALGVQAGEANLTLRVTNGSAPLNLSAAEVSLDLQGQRIAEALLSLSQAVPPGTAEAVQLRVPLMLRTLPAPIADRLRRGDELELVARGLLKGEAAGTVATLPFQALRNVHPRALEPGSEP